MKRLMTIMAFLALFVAQAQGQQVITADITSNTTWTSNNEYLLDGLIFVDSLVTLTIEPGTVIKAKKQANITTGDGASALIIRRGARLIADGTATDPIVFTSEDDNGGNLTAIDRGLWGGLILLGRATTNQPDTLANQIEGIPTSENALFGGNDDADNSGILRYISIRHGGFSISGVPGDEINGLTMGAVGYNTVIEHIEVFANFDDGYEWFGGTVNCRWLVAAFCGDDGFDYDMGFRGKGQFWFAIQGPDEAGRGGEHDGGDDDETGLPYAIPQISNATYIGAGSALNPPPGGDGSDRGIYFRDNAGGKYFNSIFTEFTGYGVDVEDLTSGSDSRERLEQGDLVLRNNWWWNFGDGNTLNDIAPDDFVRAHLTANNNTVADPLLRGVDWNSNGGLDPRLRFDSPAIGAGEPLSDNFFIPTGYVGAFDPAQGLWTDGWTALDAYGHTGDLSGGNPGMVTVTADITSNTTWTANNLYMLDGLIFVDSLNTLTIEPGTVIKAKKQANITTGDGASALIVRRGARIDAQGTPVNPIIFTSEDDNFGNLTAIDRGLWGGVILLGRATTNQPDTLANRIEGIPTSENALFGGNDDTDNSGIMTYVSIRHGGFSISGVPGDEINGLTMGAVGSSTTIHHIEVFANFDDGYEWFGGTVNTKYLVAAFCGDDGYDYDMGFRGKGQFWFGIQGPDEAGRGGEHDGGDDDETGTPYAIPQISNATYIGAGSALNPPPGGDGSDRAIYFRDNAGGKYYNSIYTEFTGYGVDVEDLTSGSDSRERLEQGDLVLNTNYWWAFGDGNTLNDIAPDDFVRTHLLANNNTVADPGLTNISWQADNSLDPRPGTSAPTATGANIPGGGFFSNVSYLGAFDPDDNLWTEGWTALSQYGHTVATALSIDDNLVDSRVPESFVLGQNYPNPFNPSTSIPYSVAKGATVKLSVYNVRGQEVATLVNGFRQPGQYLVTWNAIDVPSGVYFYRFEAGSTVETKKMMLIK